MFSILALVASVVALAFSIYVSRTQKQINDQRETETREAKERIWLEEFHKNRIQTKIDLDMRKQAAGKEVQHDNPWVERTCRNRLKADGDVMLEHMLRSNGIVRGEPDSFWLKDEDRRRIFPVWRNREYAEKELAEWNAAIECGQHHKYLRGVNAQCPKCKGCSTDEGNFEGIPC